MINLRPYQIEALESVNTALSRNITRPLIVLPTGTGKTHLFVALTQTRTGRTIIIVHRDELIDQTFKSIRKVNPGAIIGIVKGKQNQHGAPIVIASVQTLARVKRLEQIVSDFQTIIVDEAHHAISASHRRVLTYLRAFESENPPLVLGVTATPDRQDKIGLDKVFQEIVYSQLLDPMVKAGYLVEPKGIQIKLDIPDFSSIKTRNKDYASEEVEKIFAMVGAPKRIVEALMLHARMRKTLIFTPGVMMAKAVAEECRNYGFKAEHIDGTQDSKLRHEILSRFRSGETQVLANCQILTEGFDDPSADCVVIARPTKSRALYTQMVGRVLRLSEGKKDALILDLVGNSVTHDLVVLPSIYGEREEKEKEKKKRKKKEKAVAKPAIASPQDGPIVEESVNLLQMRAIRSEPEENDYQRTFKKSEKSDSDDEPKPKKKGGGLPTIRLWPEGSWQNQPATTKQIAFLKWRGFDVDSSLSKGNAHEMISRWKATDLIGRLRSKGFSVYLKKGMVYVGPRKLLTEEIQLAVRDLRDCIFNVLEQEAIDVMSGILDTLEKQENLFEQQG